MHYDEEKSRKTHAKGDRKRTRAFSKTQTCGMVVVGFCSCFWRIREFLGESLFARIDMAHILSMKIVASRMSFMAFSRLTICWYLEISTSSSPFFFVWGYINNLAQNNW